MEQDQYHNNNSLKIEITLFCPVCGLFIGTIDKNLQYCQHVEFIYGWSLEHENFWIHVSNNFSKNYCSVNMAMEIFKEYLGDTQNEKELYTEIEKAISTFIERKFEPGAYSVQLIPFKLDKAKESCGNNSIVLGVDEIHSGVYVGIRI